MAGCLTETPSCLYVIDFYFVFLINISLNNSLNLHRKERFFNCYNFLLYIIVCFLGLCSSYSSLCWVEKYLVFTNICLSLFLVSYKVYLVFIFTWVAFDQAFSSFLNLVLQIFRSNMSQNSQNLGPSSLYVSCSAFIYIRISIIDAC